MNRTSLAALALTIAYVALIRDSAMWLVQALMAPAARGNLIVVAVVLVIVASRVRRVRPQLTLWPCACVALSAAAYVVTRWAMPWNRLHAVVALVGLYGLVGIVVPSSAWRRGLAALGLVLVALPFGEQLDVLVGYPLRLVITGAAQALLEHLGAHGTSRATLLVFESGAAQIDVPCSGVKSLWAGALLALAAPLVLHKCFNKHWVAVTVTLAAALVVGNTLRIVALVLIAVPAHQAALAEILHRPLGCIGFVATAATYVAVLMRVRPVRQTQPRVVAVRPMRAVALAAVLLVLARVAPAAAATSRVVDETPFMTLPSALAATPIVLSPVERAFFSTQGADHASKVQFTWNEATHGSLLVVRSAHAAAQHPPEQCLTSAGHSIRAARTLMLGSTLSVRVLELERGTAVSWFQSGYATHGDYAERVWASGTWVQVSLLLDDASLPIDLIYALYRAVAVTYQGEADASAQAL